MGAEPAMSELHFTLGPVQGFVAQARRSRDFWAGSFLLSWLSAVAMRTVRAHRGRILFPAANEGFLAWLEGRGSGEAPRQGNVPNRFKAEVPRDLDPERIVESVRLAWQSLAEKVWQKDLAAVAGPEQRAIWQRQVEGFWEIQWALTDDPAATSVLDRRKLWRSHLLPAEPGLKCMVIEGLQELSAAPCPGLRDSSRELWGQVRENLAGWKQDLGEAEQLSAIAFIKRRFAHHFPGLRVAMPGGWSLRGWPMNPAVPSVVYMAAVHWLEGLLLREEEGALRQLEQAAAIATERYSTLAEEIPCIRRAQEERDWEKPLRFSSEGGMFFRSALENPREFSPERARPMLQALDALSTREAPSPFYAVLVMDGDNLGRHLGRPENQPALTRALRTFTGEVPSIVERHNGFLVYAGGDDVLAILPLEDALACATALHAAYGQAFAATSIPSTLSGAVLFVHFKNPLGGILAEAHTLLDALAKDARGRDALAVRVEKPGGPVLTWAMPWKKALAPTAGGERLQVEAIAEDFRRFDGERPEFSNRFFFKIRELFELLNPEEDEAAKERPHTGESPAAEPILSPGDARALLTAEFLASGKNVGLSLSTDEAETAITPLLTQCRPVCREVDATGTENWLESARLEADGALLVRFLVQKGRLA